MLQTNYTVKSECTHEEIQELRVREVLLRDNALGRLQVSSSAGEVGSLGGPMSPRPPRTLPNRLPEVLSSDDALGTNLLPFAQTSSVSAGPWDPPSWALNPEPRRLKPGSSSAGGLDGDARAGARLDLQSLMLSETAGGGGSREGPSKRRLVPSPREGASGSGPSRRQLPENLSSSNPPPPNPERSLATRH